MPKRIKEDALFIADAHYPHHGDKFLTILHDLANQKQQTPQLFLMGDIFDLLFGYNNYIQTFSHDAITLLQTLSESMEIHYFEGNHDFCLQTLFPLIHVYPRKEQPTHFRLGTQDVYLSHGDRYETGRGYELYTRILRNRLTLSLLKPFEKPIIHAQIRQLKQKNICKPLENFESKVEKIRQHYPKESLVIEGHFHQGIQKENYFSLPSLVCQKAVGRIRNGTLIFEKP